MLSKACVDNVGMIHIKKLIFRNNITEYRSKVDIKKLERNFIMKNKSTMIAISFVLLAMLLSLSVYAASSATASSTGASASVSTSQASNLEANASINSRLYYASDTDSGIKTYAFASVSASELPDLINWPVENSRASAFIGNDLVAYDSWPH